MAQSLFKLLADRFPDTPIDVIAPGWSLPVLERMPEVRNGIALAVGHGELGIAARRKLGRQLRGNNYRQAIVLPRSAKAALVPWHARIRQRTGFKGEFRFGLINDMRAFDPSVLDQTVKRYVALGLANGQPLPNALPHPLLHVDRDAQRDALERLSLGLAKPVVALLPGAEYGPAKCWPLAHFASLSSQLKAAGADVWVIGGPKDADAGDTIVRLSAGAAVNLCGKTALTDAIDLLAVCRAVVTNDSGLMHMAAAVGTPVVALYGSTSPAFTPPLTANATIHDLELSCSPCFKRECPLGHLNCLQQILPEQVCASVSPLL